MQEQMRLMEKEKEEAREEKPIQREMKDLLQNLRLLVEDDVLEVFGPSGSGKSKFVYAIALEAKRQNLPYVFVDTERNLIQAEYESLGKAVKYFPDIRSLTAFCDKIPPGKLLIIDSLGFPILTHWARLKFDEKMKALVLMIEWVAEIKEWCRQNKAIAVITNQPESIFTQERFGREIPEPFGDKSIYAFKEVIWLEKTETLENETRILGKLYRSRKYPFMKTAFEMVIKDQITIDWKL